MNNIYTSTLSLFTPTHKHIRYTLFHKDCCCYKCKLSRHKKDTTTYITISNDVLFFTISRLTICRNSVVKYKYQPSKSLENALFSAFYLSKLFIVGNKRDALYESVRMMYQSFRIKIGRFSVLVRIVPNYLKYLTSNLCQMAYLPASNAV